MSTDPAQRSQRRRLLAELAKFGTVGGIAFVIDMGLFNLLALQGHVLDHRPTTAKIISALVATAASWVLNRSWTFAAGARRSRTRELMEFALVNGVGIAVAAATLWVAVYPLGITSDLGKNVASVVGIGLGTVVRYLGYKFVVFRGDAPREREIESITAAVDAVPLPPAPRAEAPDLGPAGSARR